MFLPYITVEGKGKGGVAGNAFLDEQVSFRFGLSARIGQGSQVHARSVIHEACPCFRK
jgi:hypothetical protein